MAFSSVEVQLIRKTREDLLRPKATTAAVTVAEWNLRQPPQRLCNHHLRHQCRHHSQVPVLQTTSRGARGRRMRPLPRTGSGAGRCDRLALPTRCRSQPGVQRCRKHNTPWSALMALGVWACRGPTRDNTANLCIACTPLHIPAMRGCTWSHAGRWRMQCACAAVHVVVMKLAERRHRMHGAGG